MALTKVKREIAIFLPVFVLVVWVDIFYYWGFDPVRNLFVGIVPVLILYIYYKLVRWVALTAEKAGRSYAGFMILAIFFPVIAAVIVLIFKKDPP